MEAQMIGSARARAGRPPLRLSLVGDERLARLVADEESERAFATLYERYHQPLYRYCRSILRNDADAQDALQSTFAGALGALRRGQRDAPLRPWLFRIAHNESVSLLRRRRPDCELSEAGEYSTASVEERAEERARLSRLVADLAELPERQRGALVMRELSGLSHEEIAVALGASVGAAKQTIFEARRSLLEFSEGRAMACEDVRRTISDADGRALRGRRVRAHLRDCSGCAAFAAAIPARGADLRALAPPLPAVAAVGLLARAAGGGSGHGAGGAGGLAAGAASKTLGLAFAAKALAGVAIVATATVGATGVLRRTVRTTRQPPAATRTASAGRAGGTVGAANLSSPTPARRTVRRAADLGAVRRGPATASAGTSTRSDGHARVATGGLGPRSSAVARSGAAARGLSSAAAHSTPTRRVSSRPTGSVGSPGAGHRTGPPASVPATGRPATPASGRPATPTPGRPTTPTSGRPSTPAAATPTTPSGSVPGTPADPATPSPSVPATAPSGSGQSPSHAR
jgi:RNA polymerase sigma factor (sigma-70 family)